MSFLEKRKRSRSPEPEVRLQRMSKDSRHNPSQSSLREDTKENGYGNNAQYNGRKEQEVFAKEQTRRNQVQEAEQMKAWVNQEDDFVLKQSKKKARIRVKEGRARTIDWLAVTLGAMDTSKDLLDEEAEDEDDEAIDPSGIFEGLDISQLQELGKDIEAYVSLESISSNRKYWIALRTICKEYQNRLGPTNSHGRSATSILADVDRLLSPKSLAELNALEEQITNKLQSNDPIDVEYWEHLLRSVSVYKAKADLNVVYKSIIARRLDRLRQEQRVEALQLQEKLAMLLNGSEGYHKDSFHEGTSTEKSSLRYYRALDPEPLLKLRVEDKALDIVEEQDLMDRIASERRRVLRLGYVPLKQAYVDKRMPIPLPKATEPSSSIAPRFAPVMNEDFSSATTALYEREVARGIQEDEEIFAGEEEISSTIKPQWANKYRPRKPRYFNRVQMGYEWNKYNQTHYDHDNPPPKVVQGYKFNVFYPDLIDKVKAPTYRIEREGGRKRGESFAPAGEEDTCLIRFISNPPYEDLAFRIVDKEWDYSAKRERGFRSSFDKVIHIVSIA